MTVLRFSKQQKSSSIPLLVVVDASRNDEARDAIIGLDRRWNLLYVVYIEPENDIIRIISARKATRKEREYYES
ncbi:BrnT family toxin [Microcystis aeruginosa]|uniref:BrnT family toxin n=1 Tax=Microcystis aeruginosa TaxID=1126 RepID=UPI002330943C|nr:BrnT family toxin [Microcystis aeruginosa]MDB9392140.1 BrnT family toxin [Microcystis aeruginosa CS-579]